MKTRLSDRLSRPLVRLINMRTFVSLKFFKVFVVAVVFGLLILLNPWKIFNPLRSIALTISYPVSKFFYGISLKITDTKDFLASIGQLGKDNEILLRKNQELTSENARLQNVENENIELREQLGMLPREKFELRAASVIGLDMKGSGGWMEIDKGSKDGMVAGMPVIVSKGVLIGKIEEVYFATARVQLITNPKSTVNIMTAKGGSMGVVKGEYGLGLSLDMVLQSDQLNVGDAIVTSGVGGNFPRGLYVGTLQEIHPSEDNLFQQGVIVSPVQIAKSQFVFVVMRNL